MSHAPLKSLASLSLALSALFALGACGPKPDAAGTITPAPMTTPSTSPSGTTGGAMPPASAPASK